MAPVRPVPSGPGANAKPSSGPARPMIFSGSARRPGRIEKKTTPASQGTRKHKQEKSLDPTEADAEETAQLALDRPELEGRGSVEWQDSSRGGPELRNIADLLLDLDKHQNFKIPTNGIIASEDVDARVYQQMRRLAPGQELTPGRVRKNLISSVEDLRLRWGARARHGRPAFWRRACNGGDAWMRQLDAADCREFFLWLVAYYRHGSGKKATNELTRGFEGLSELFAEERDCEVDELVGIEARVRPQAKQARGRGRAAVSKKKKDSVSKPVAGNMFRLSGNTNMTDDELRDADAQGLTPIVDVGDSRRKAEAWKRVFDEELEADRARIAAEKAKKAAGEQAAATKAAAAPTRSRKRSPRERSTPAKGAKAARKLPK